MLKSKGSLIPERRLTLVGAGRNRLLAFRALQRPAAQRGKPGRERSRRVKQYELIRADNGKRYVCERDTGQLPEQQ